MSARAPSPGFPLSRPSPISPPPPAGAAAANSPTPTTSGPSSAAAHVPPGVLLVGDQPGDAEDRAGRPFMGRAARLLERALGDAGFHLAEVYVTTAVKHFRFQQVGVHRRPLAPDPVHLLACRPWLRAEFAALDPELVVALGGTAGRALAGPSFRIGRDRGVLMTWPTTAAPGLLPDTRGRAGAHLLGTVHPAAVLRAEDFDAAYGHFVDDLRVGAKELY